MAWIAGALVFCLGLILGLFYHKIIYRIIPQETPTKGGSMGMALATGALFFLAFCLSGISLATLCRMLLWSMLLITAFIDYREMVIADVVLLVFTLLAAPLLFFMGNIKTHLLGLAFCFAFYYTIYFLVKQIYKKEAFGLGDVFLMSAAGFFLGLEKGALAAFFSFYTALLGMGLQFLLGKINSLKQEFPFGPAICAAVFLADILGQSIIDAYISFLF